MAKPPFVVPEPGWGDRSETPRVDAFMADMPMIPMRDPLETANAITQLVRSWSEFARELERECSRKVWPH